MLTADQQWERRCVIAEEGDSYLHDILYGAPIIGIWDYGDVLLLLFEGWRDGIDRLCMYHVATETMYRANLPCDLNLQVSDYEICWGYRPTLLSPGSIVGELNQVNKEPRRHLSAEVMKLLTPVKEQDRRKGRKATVHTVCFMEFLVYIMRKLPHDMQDLIGVP
ncbi:hypothetical protein PR202_ga19188 [Eleusine coracana subsp. coracana]|uniref:Uncharacterized protein n=1 Tax=Eleusine coracana subsp. coracana TaxID=191504 RepID=A0AAV5CUR9_ELECO|nr:hypothetical protein PR202_ga19188 [Eleusine coracana subsp. coracana]